MSDRNDPSPDDVDTLPPAGSSRRRFLVGSSMVTGSLATWKYANAAAPRAPPDAVASNSATRQVRLSINRQAYVIDIEPRVTLLDALRENIGLTGTKKGCDRGQCGACTVLVNGRRVNACLTLAMACEGDEVTTVEGIAGETDLHPVQRAFIEHDGFQCGYCTPGQICSAVALRDEWRAGNASGVTPDLAKPGAVELTDDEIRERMSGNICRCGAYVGIVAAVRQATKDS